MLLRATRRSVGDGIAVVSPLGTITHPHSNTNYPPMHQNLCVMFGPKIKTAPQLHFSIYTLPRPARGTPLLNYELVT